MGGVVGVVVVVVVLVRGVGRYDSGVCAARRKDASREPCQATYRSSFLYRERFNLADARLLADEVPPVPPLGALGGPCAAAWRNYMKSTFKPGYLYTISYKPEVLVYVVSNKTLAGAEVRGREGEALGRHLVVTFYKCDERGFAVRALVKDDGNVEQDPLSLAELLQTLGYMLPPDPDRTAATAELLLEAVYQDLEVMRFKPVVQPEAGLHVYALAEETLAEDAFMLEAPPDQRTKMTLARLLQRQGAYAAGETLPLVWALSHANLLARAAPHLPAPPAPAAAAAAPPGAPPAGPPGAPAGPAKGRGRGRGRGPRGGRGRGAA